jgi:DNA-binding NtrC family response regulator
VSEANRILIVDDDIGMSETLSDILSDVEYDVSIINDGYKAIDMIRKNSYDLVLLDIKMPVINGVETYKKIKAIIPSLKVIMMTAYSVEELVEEAINEGAFGIVYKPMNVKNLLAIIEKLLKNINILIVDDDSNFCEIFKAELEEMNYSTVVKYNGVQAIDYVKENSIDIIFIDIKMPDLNGFEVYQAIKKLNPNLDAIMITGYQNETQVLHQINLAFKKNLYACFYKPIKFEEINSTIKKILRKNLKIAEKGI